MSNDIEFDEWWEALNFVATERGLLHFLSPDQEDHRQGWADGYTPEDELDEQIGAANS